MPDPATPPLRKQMNVLPPHLTLFDIAPTGCWLWTGDHTEGYGRAYVPRPDGTKGRQVRAHCAIYEALVGPIPTALVLDHLCRVTLCVRPEHLEPVTQAVNMARGAVNGGVLYMPRPKPLVCKYGHPYDAQNTRIVKRGPSAGCYECRTCATMRRRWIAATKWKAENLVSA